MLNPINFAKTSAQFIYTNSSSAVTAITSRVNKIFKSTINVLVDGIQSTTNFIYIKASNAIYSISNYFFETPKANINAVYRKAIGETKEELKILPNFKKINFLNKSENFLTLEKISDLSLADTKKLWKVWASEKTNN
ncbi:MAG: hypothetical protein ACRCSV_03485 [Chlamydiales bacterium]